MPKRTNDFQQLVANIQRALASRGATVTESFMTDGREIDVLIEDAVGPYRIKIAVEAKDEGRALDIGRFEAIVGKYLVDGGVKVDKIVIITHRGFSERVIERARKVGVDLRTLKEAGTTDWLKFDPRLWHLNTMFRITNVELSPLPEGVHIEALIAAGRMVCSHGRDCGSPIQFAWGLFWNDAMRTQTATLKELARDAEQKLEGCGARLEFQFPACHPCVVRLGGHDYPLKKVSYVVHVKAVPEAVRTSTAQFKLDIPPHICGIEVSPPVPGVAHSDLWSRATLVCCGCGKDHGLLRTWLAKKIRCDAKSHPEMVSQIGEIARGSADGQAWYDINYRIRNGAIRIDKAQFPIESITAVVYSATAPMRSTQYELESADGPTQSITRLEVTVADRTIEFVLPDGLASDRIVLKMGPTAKVSAEQHVDCDDCGKAAPTD